MDAESGTLTRAQLAKKAGVGLEAIRFYERKGLLLPAFRDGSNYRRYLQGSVEELLFISEAKKLGFALCEIKEIQEIRDLAHTPCAKMREKARVKISQIVSKIKELDSMRTKLGSLLAQCESGEPDDCCVILEDIES